MYIIGWNEIPNQFSLLYPTKKFFSNYSSWDGHVPHTGRDFDQLSVKCQMMLVAFQY